MALVALLCAVCYVALAATALATDTGEVWLDWVWEQAGAGIHAKWYYHFEQAAAEIQAADNESCTNGWYGTKGSWVFGHDYCAYQGYQASTPRLAAPGVGAYPWAQTKLKNDYLWAWARYCSDC